MKIKVSIATIDLITHELSGKMEAQKSLIVSGKI